jgi:hypothetical protein
LLAKNVNISLPGGETAARPRDVVQDLRQISAC